MAALILYPSSKITILYSRVYLFEMRLRVLADPEVAKVTPLLSYSGFRYCVMSAKLLGKIALIAIGIRGNRL